MTVYVVLKNKADEKHEHTGPALPGVLGTAGFGSI